jgi:hypothetical protein
MLRVLRTTGVELSPSVHKFDEDFIQTSAELSRCPQDLVLPSAMRHVDEQFGLELTAERLMSSRSGRME